MGDGKVRVTYLICTKNRGKFLGGVLDNVREFITADDELLIIDGLSTDETPQVVENHRDIVTLFLSEPDVSEGHALNKGFARARGEYIKIISDDDYFYPDAMRQLIAEMDANPEVEAIQAGGELWDRREGEASFVSFRPERPPATVYEMFDLAVSGLGTIMRRKVLEKIGGVASRHHLVDADILCSLIECGCDVRYLDIKAYRHYRHGHSGVNQYARSHRDFVIFDVRMGRWPRVLRRRPEDFGLETSNKRDLARLHWLDFAGMASRSPFWFFAPAITRAMRAAANMLRGRPKSIASEVQAGWKDREWSGRLS